jgi:hypothetical protein
VKIEPEAGSDVHLDLLSELKQRAERMEALLWIGQT